MELTARQTGSVIILDLRGRLTIEENLGDLERVVKGLVRRDRGAVVLNLGRVSHLDAAGIGHLVLVHTHVHNAGGRLALTSLSRPLRNLLEVVHLLPVFDTYADEETAVRSLQRYAPRRARHRVTRSSSVGLTPDGVIC